MFDDWWYLYLFWKEELTYYLYFHSSLMSYDIVQGDFLEPDCITWCYSLSGGSGSPAISLMPSWLGVAWCCSVLLSIAQCCSALLNAAQHCSVLLGNARHYSVLLSAVRCCTPLHAVACCCIPLHAAIPWHWLALLSMKKMF